MKAVVAAVVGVLIAAGSFALYRWLDEDEERARAEAALNTYCFTVVPCGDGRGARPLPAVARTGRGPCVTSELAPIRNSDVWRFRITCGRGSHCEAIDLENFRATRNHSVYVGASADGVTTIPCSADDWTARQAASRLERSSWARARKARFFSCLPATAVAVAHREWVLGRETGGRPFSRWEQLALTTPYWNRFGCNYIKPRGHGYVVIRTTGPDTFKMETSR
jgi:hypothetical protein